MTKEIMWLLLSSLMSLSLVMAACGPAATPTTPTTPTPVAAPTSPTAPATPAAPATPTEKEAVKPAPEVPKYGGTFTYRINADQTAWDPYFGGDGANRLWFETVSMGNWMGIPPEVNDFKTRESKMTQYTGLLAESWELGDMVTLTFKIRKGIRWQNIAPVNGRELTAYDLVYSYNRMLGLGDGFTKPSTYVSVVNWNKIVSVTAPDKYTLVIKNSEPSLEGTRTLLDDHFVNSAVPREAVAQWGDLNDWKRQIGSGPFILKEYVAGSSLTAVRNPGYFGHDELRPQNQLPYVDRVVYLTIPDNSTADAAMRTGKLDWVGGIEWERANYFKKTSPQLLMADMPMSAITLHVQVDKPPFNDIRVRKALQMSLDLKTLAATYYGGTVPGTPVGAIAHQGYRADYDSWPQEVKDGYAYNPEGAKKLLAEAGYPSGFKTTITTTAINVDLLSIIKDYWSKVNVDLVFDVKESGAYNTYVGAGNAVMSTPTRGAGAAWGTLPPVPALSYKTKAHPLAFPQGRISDPVMEDLYIKVGLSLDEDKRMGLIREADMYIISQQWTINLVRRITYEVYQPWVKGYKDVSLTERTGHIFSRLWIDQGLKKAMGY